MNSIVLLSSTSSSVKYKIGYISRENRLLLK